MVFEPISRKKTYTEVFLRLQELFENGTLRPGEKLPSERSIAEMLQVSRNSLREAFRVLEILGLIDIIPGSGTYVRENQGDIILPLAISLSVEQNSMLELMEVRQIIETQCARLAAQRTDEKDLQELQATLDKMKNSIGDPKAYVQADILFHHLIAKSSKNTLLLRLFSTFTEHMSETLSVLREKRFTSIEKAQATVEEHIKIYQAIKNNDVNLAGRLMYQHVSDAAQEIK